MAQIGDYTQSVKHFECPPLALLVIFFLEKSVNILRVFFANKGTLFLGDFCFNEFEKNSLPLELLFLSVRQPELGVMLSPQHLRGWAFTNTEIKRSRFGNLPLPRVGKKSPSFSQERIALDDN